MGGAEANVGKDNVYYGGQATVNRYLEAARVLGFSDKVVLSDKKPVQTWEGQGVVVSLNPEESKQFWAKVLELETEVGL